MFKSKRKQIVNIQVYFDLRTVNKVINASQSLPLQIINR